jgi:uncharacterized protein YjeT (DUF2065 family)
MMKRTHRSLFYVIGYLIPGGLGLLIAPQMALKLLFSNGNYGDVMPRMVGMLMVALGVILLQVVRHRQEVLYSTALVIRSGMLPILYSFYILSHDPLFLALMAIVGIGVVFTSVSYWQDLKRRM